MAYDGLKSYLRLIKGVLQIHAVYLIRHSCDDILITIATTLIHDLFII